ncbi:hypothetical protein [Cyclobacterium sp.]|uniref:hypothetical protein n=1 Tax=Cyclobacterium sp. TaxID=1966343 RepID=UPI001989A487|nr:hypothetical protein [Cyclobacterium sp.]MBD3630485.1 hypothetical protein [Cyclobacterium sp.]
MQYFSSQNEKKLIPNFVYMKFHRGEILRKKLDEYAKEHAVSILAIAKKASYHPSSAYRHFEKDDLSFNIIHKYGRAIGHDFSKEFPEMLTEYGFSPEEKEIYSSSDLAKCIKEKELWQKKYIELLEEHNKLLMGKLEQSKG